MTKVIIKDILQAVELLQQGEILGYPTEAVFGLGVDASQPEAIKKLRNLKNRSSKGLIIIADRWECIQPWVGTLSDNQINQMLESWPGPYTWIVPASPLAPKTLQGEDGTLAVRIPDHTLCQQLCKHLDHPIVSTSANPKGMPPAKTTSEFINYFEEVHVLDGKVGNQSKPSTIKDIRTGKVLR